MKARTTVVVAHRLSTIVDAHTIAGKSCVNPPISESVLPTCYMSSLLMLLDSRILWALWPNPKPQTLSWKGCSHCPWNALDYLRRHAESSAQALTWHLVECTRSPAKLSVTCMHYTQH
jgi:hypothetical protein